MKPTQLFEEICSKDFGIRHSHAIDAIKTREQVDIIRDNGFELHLYLKHIGEAKPPHSLLVILSKEQAKEQIDFALKLYPDLAPGFEGMTPLQLMEAFAGRFGLPFMIGDQTSRFVLHKKIPFAGPQPVRMSGAVPKNHKVTAQMWLRVEGDTTKVAVCSLCFALDIDQYVAWLKEHKG